MRKACLVLRLLPAFGHSGKRPVHHRPSSVAEWRVHFYWDSLLCSSWPSGCTRHGYVCYSLRGSLINVDSSCVSRSPSLRAGKEVGFVQTFWSYASHHVYRAGISTHDGRGACRRDSLAGFRGGFKGQRVAHTSGRLAQELGSNSKAREGAGQANGRAGQGERTVAEAG